MNRARIGIILFATLLSFGIAETQTGFFVSLKDIEMRVDFSGDAIKSDDVSGNLSEFFFKLSNISPGKIELSLILNLSKGSVINSENQIIEYSRIGTGAELGKIFNLFYGSIFGKKCTFDMVWGISGIVYFNGKSDTGEFSLTGSEEQKDKLLYDFGIFSSLKIGITMKNFYLYIGFQSIYPLYSKSILTDEKVNFLKSYLFFGVAF